MLFQPQQVAMILQHVELTTSQDNQTMERPDGQENSNQQIKEIFQSVQIRRWNIQIVSLEESSTLKQGRLLSSDDAGTNNCVIETNLATDNDLNVGDTFTVYTTINEETVTQQLTIVGIYEVTDAKTMGGPGQSNPFNTIYTDLSIGQTLSGSETNITSATYYLDDPENIEAFQTLARKKE